jgi:outer membrane receptor protein involved in Fe transport
LQLPDFNELSNLNRRDADYYVNDKINFSNDLNASLGVRVETASYVGLPAPGLDTSTCTFLYNPSSVTPNTNPSVDNGCPFIPTFNVTSAETSPSEVEPRVGLSWQLSRDTALRFTYNRTTTFPILALTDNIVGTSPTGNIYSPYDKVPADAGAVCGLAPYYVPCDNLGEETFWTMQNFEGVPYQTFQPMTANNYQITLSHQFTKGILNGVAISLAPWTTHQYETEASLAQPVLQANGQPLIINGTVVNGPAVATNLGSEHAAGVDLNITKQSAVGLSGQFTASYINEFSSVIPTSGSEDFFPSVPYASALAGDVYRVGFISPFQATMGLTWKTPTGFRINPRLYYDIGYPVGGGNETAIYLNGKAVTPTTSTR